MGGVTAAASCLSSGSSVLPSVMRLLGTRAWCLPGGLAWRPWIDGGVWRVVGDRIKHRDDASAMTMGESDHRPQVILRWHMQHGIITIPKSANPQRMAENLDVFDFELTDEEITAIDALDRGVDGRVGPNPDTYEDV